MSLVSRGFAASLKRSEKLGTWVFAFLFFDKDNNGGRAMVEEIVKERLFKITRFRSRFAMRKNREFFVELDEDEVDLDYHIRIIDEKLTLQQIQDDYAGNPYKHMNFDINKPLWVFYFFPETAEGDALLLTNINHAIGDGVSQVEILHTIMDGGEYQKATMGPVDDTGEDEIKGDESKALVSSAGPNEGGIGGLTPGLAPKKRGKPKNHFGPINKTRLFLGGILQASTAAFSSTDTPNSIMRDNVKDASLQKSLAFSETIALDQVKEIKSKYRNATVNDILVSILTLTLIAHLKVDPVKNKKVLAGDGTLRASFPISMRKNNEPAWRDGEPQNKTSMGFLKFPTTFKSRTQLVHTIKKKLDRVKLSPQPFVQLRLGKMAAAVLPKGELVKMLAHVLQQTTGQLSNVQGPTHQVTVGGYPLKDLRFSVWGVQSLYVGLISYNGRISLSINMDEESGPASAFASNWTTEFNALYEETMAAAAKSPDGFVPAPVTFASCLERL